MRDNSEIEDLTKINTQTGFQPIYTFIMRSGRAMIYDILINLSKSLRGLSHSLSLEGLVNMTSATIRDFSPLGSQASSFKVKPTVKASATSIDASSTTPISSESATFHRNRQATFPEIFSYALPSSPEVLKLNELVEQIWIIREGTSLVDRDDSKIAEAFLLMSSIIDAHWNEFSVKTKVLLLDKLQPFNKSIWRFLLDIVIRIPAALKEKSERNEKYTSQYSSLDTSARQDLNRKFLNNFQLLVKSVMKNLETTSNIFEKDGYLLEENRGNIEKFNYSLKTMLSARQGIKDYHQTLIELAK
jgi:hypothetical protein